MNKDSHISKIWDLLVNKILFALIEGVCELILILIVATAFYIFIGRYVFNHTPAWGEPLCLLALVWLCILSSVLSVRDETFLRLTAFDKKLPPKVILCLEVLTTLCILVFSWFLVTAGWKLQLAAAGNNIAGLNIPQSWFYLVEPITGVLYVFALLEMWRRKIVSLSAENKEDDCHDN